MKLCIAGKNNIAVDCLYFAMNFLTKNNICVIVNKNDEFKNKWQRSLGFYANFENIAIRSLEEVQKIEDIVFLSLEFDRIIKPNLFKTSRLYNIHFSLLPEYKGMYTALLPILHGKKKSGVSLHKIDNGIDTGDIIEQTIIDIENITSYNLYNKYLEEGTKLVCSNMHQLLHDNVIAWQQSSKNSSYFSKTSFDFKNREINPFQTAFQIQQFVNALNFRVYQLPVFNAKEIYKVEIKEKKSKGKPGDIIFEDIQVIEIETIDYRIILYKDYYNELINYCRTNNIEEAKQIITLIPNIDEVESSGWSPLMIACYFGSDKIVDLLLQYGANPHLTNLNGTTTLMYAKDAYLKDKKLTIIDKLISRGVNIASTDIYGKNILDYIDDIELINYLKSKQ